MMSLLKHRGHRSLRPVLGPTHYKHIKALANTTNYIKGRSLRLGTASVLLRVLGFIGSVNQILMTSCQRPFSVLIARRFVHLSRRGRQRIEPDCGSGTLVASRVAAGKDDGMSRAHPWLMGCGPACCRTHFNTHSWLQTTQSDACALEAAC